MRIIQLNFKTVPGSDDTLERLYRYTPIHELLWKILETNWDEVGSGFLARNMNN